eukprot:169261-Pelagomonas_calceolata.AAC.1
MPVGRPSPHQNALRAHPLTDPRTVPDCDDLRVKSLGSLRAGPQKLRNSGVPGGVRSHFGNTALESRMTGNCHVRFGNGALLYTESGAL